jgi:hypothetical protein
MAETLSADLFMALSRSNLLNGVSQHSVRAPCSRLALPEQQLSVLASKTLLFSLCLSVSLSLSVSMCVRIVHPDHIILSTSSSSSFDLTCLPPSESPHLSLSLHSLLAIIPRHLHPSLYPSIPSFYVPILSLPLAPQFHTSSTHAA